MARVLIAGCGEVGSLLGVRLTREGHEVWALRRRPSGLPPGLKPLAADLTRKETLACLPPGLDTVFYTAAADGFTEAAYESAYVTGLTHVLEVLASRGDGPRRILFTSSTSVYAQDSGDWVDERSPAEPSHFSGKQVRVAEELLLDGAVPATVVRFGGIYGPTRTRLLDRVRAGEATCVEDPPAYTNRIHVEDCAGVLEHVAALDEPAPVYVGVDDEPAALCLVLRWISERMGACPPKVVAAASAGARGPRSNKRCSNRLLRASGYRFEYPTFREGYGAILGGGTAESPP